MKESNANKIPGSNNPEIDNFIYNFIQNFTQGNMMGGMNLMNPPMPPQGVPGRPHMANKPPPMRVQPPRSDPNIRGDMYAQRPGPAPVSNYPPNPTFNQNMMRPTDMHMMQPGGGFNQMKMPMQLPTHPPMPTQMPPMVHVSEDAQYLQSYNEIVNSPEYQSGDIEFKKNKFGDLIYPYVEKKAGEENAPKITGMIIDLEIPDLEASACSLMMLYEKIHEGLNLLDEEENN